MDRDGWTSLHWAAKGGSVEIPKSLINLGSVSISEFINVWVPQAIASYHHYGRLQILTFDIHVRIASGCSGQKRLLAIQHLKTIHLLVEIKSPLARDENQFNEAAISCESITKNLDHKSY